MYLSNFRNERAKTELKDMPKPNHKINVYLSSLHKVDGCLNNGSDFWPFASELCLLI